MPWGRLESVWAGNRLGGSNPLPSACINDIAHFTEWAFSLVGPHSHTNFTYLSGNKRQQVHPSA
jgi:hypothetical protein